MPTDVYRRGADLRPAVTAAHGIGTTGALLLRSDGFVAWRAETSPADPAALAGAMAFILGPKKEWEADMSDVSDIEMAQTAVPGPEHKQVEALIGRPERRVDRHDQASQVDAQEGR